MVADACAGWFTGDAYGDGEVGTGKRNVDESGQEGKGSRMNQQQEAAPKAENNEWEENADKIGVFRQRRFAACGGHHGAEVKVDVLPAQVPGKHPADAVQQFM